MAERNRYEIKTSKGSVRKYPNVIWFPRSKTDPREIREVLKIALKTQNENPEGFFNDKLLGIKMARIGSISVVGLSGDEYVKSYEHKSTGDVSFITNARMLMRLFRFLGLVRRTQKGRYVVTDTGRHYCEFNGDFPSFKNGVSEERVLLECLANFGFYSVGDDASYRDSKFRVRPFLWLLHNLDIEPQCIFQLIVTAFASKEETDDEEARIKNILKKLRDGSTNLKNEWKRLGLDADNYSCVHNFYDSVKILVYLGMSLGLIVKTSDAEYGKKITGGARHLKQANIFYAVTEKGKRFLEANLSSKLVYYDQIYSLFGDGKVLDVAFLLATLNYRFGKIVVTRIHRGFYKEILDLDKLIAEIESKLNISIDSDSNFVSLRKPISFSFDQQIPPEIMGEKTMARLYAAFMKELPSGKNVQVSEDINTPKSEKRNLASYFQVDENVRYLIPARSEKELENAIRYPGMEEVFGGKDRFSGRVSPTNSMLIFDGTLYVDQDTDALDFLVALRLNDENLKAFINNNIESLIKKFLIKSDTWEKDQHYTWVRNVFRHLGMEALYSGSSGMLSRADVSVSSPFVAGIEAKSPRENRGTLNTKAIRQAVDAKIQVAAKNVEGKKLARIAMAVGRRISENAIREERKWASEGQPVLLVHDIVLHYLVLKSASVKFSAKSLTKFFTANHGPVTRGMLRTLLEENLPGSPDSKQIDDELDLLNQYCPFEKDEG